MSLEDLVEDLHINQDAISISDEQRAKNFDAQDDKLNWTTLCEILDRYSDQVDTIGQIIIVLKGLCNRFTYISSSLEWLEARLKALRTTPIQLSEHSDDSSWNSSDSDEKSSSESDSDDEMPGRRFLPSLTYDWSKTEADIQSVEEAISMATLMAIYEIIDTCHISDADFDEMFRLPMLSNWNGSTNEALFEALRYLSQHFEATYSHSSVQDSYRHGEQKNVGVMGEMTAADQDKHQQQYPTTKLNPERHEIRLLELLPGLDDQPIEGSLSIVSLDDTPTYEALSYAWGSSSISKTIQLNQTEFSITPNLQTALFHLRKENESRRLWVDAICINQDDPEEKQHQVQLMSKIYPDAQTVLCWLGPEEDNSSFVISYILDISPTIRTSDDESESDRESSISESEESEELLNGIFKLLTRPWWSRVWTCQEFALTSRDPILICGNQQISWSVFHRVLKSKGGDVASAALSSSGFELSTAAYWKMNGGLAHVARIIGLWTRKRPSFSLWNGQNIHLLFGVVYHTRHYQSTEPRDKVFAVLSFLDEPYRTLFPPNYTQSMEMIYTKFTAAILAVGREGDIYKCFSLENRASKALPSWAVNFASQTIDGSYDPTIFRLADYDNVLDASKGAKVQCLPIGPRLLIRGVLFDTICATWKVQEGDEVNLPSFYARLSGLCSQSQIASQRDLHEADPAYPIRHLRTKDGFIDVVTGGMCNQVQFERAFDKWNPSRDEMPNIARSTPSQSKEEIDIAHQIGAPSPPSHVKDGEGQGSSSSSHSDEDEEIEEEDFHLMIHSTSGRTVFNTASGFFGIGVKGVEKGDIVAVLFGIAIPFVLRDFSTHYEFVGGSRIGGIMNGELMEFVDDGTFQARSFCIR